MHVPFVDLKAQYRQIKPEIEAAIARVVENGNFILGPEVERFEKEFASYLGVNHCLGVSNGTTAIQLALVACDVGHGDEVIVPANTFIATAEAVSHTGAKPVFVDVDPVSRNIKSSEIAAAITTRTRAIIPVHLYGLPADLDPIFELTIGRNIAIIEDAAQAHGAMYKGKNAGTIGRAGCFSFYPGKNLGAYGEGGAVVTNDDELADRIRLLRDHGSRKKYSHELIGFNARLEGIQGAVLSVKLAHLDHWNAKRREHAARYSDLLSGLPLTLPVEIPYVKSVYHLYVVLSQRRDELQRVLSENDIQTGLHYPTPVHLQPAYSGLGYRKGDLPVAEELAANLLSLPMFPELTSEQIEHVANCASYAF